MPSVLLTESIAVELGANEPWPEDAKLYQPYQDDQILLPCNANSLSVQAFLRMCGLDFEVEMRTNAEHMSPSGNIPFLKCGSFVVAEFDHIVSFVDTKGIHLSDRLDFNQRADMRAYMSLINNVLVNAELYISWCDGSTMEKVTKPRYGSVYPWPLNVFLTWRKQFQVTKRLSNLDWKNKTLDDVYAEVDDCCKALSERLETNNYFFNKATELDALLFGHIYAILTTDLPDNRLASVIRSHQNLIELCQRIDREYFGSKPESGGS